MLWVHCMKAVLTIHTCCACNVCMLWVWYPEISASGFTFVPYRLGILLKHNLRTPTFVEPQLVLPCRHEPSLKDALTTSFNLICCCITEWFPVISGELRWILQNRTEAALQQANQLWTHMGVLVRRYSSVWHKHQTCPIAAEVFIPWLLGLMDISIQYADCLGEDSSTTTRSSNGSGSSSSSTSSEGRRGGSSNRSDIASSNSSRKVITTKHSNSTSSSPSGTSTSSTSTSISAAAKEVLRMIADVHWSVLTCMDGITELRVLPVADTSLAKLTARIHGSAALATASKAYLLGVFQHIQEQLNSSQQDSTCSSSSSTGASSSSSTGASSSSSSRPSMEGSQPRDKKKGSSTALGSSRGFSGGSNPYSEPQLPSLVAQLPKEFSPGVVALATCHAGSRRHQMVLLLNSTSAVIDSALLQLLLVGAVLRGKEGSSSERLDMLMGLYHAVKAANGEELCAFVTARGPLLLQVLWRGTKGMAEQQQQQQISPSLGIGTAAGVERRERNLYKFLLGTIISRRGCGTEGRVQVLFAHV